MRLLRRLLTILAAIGLVFGIAVPAQAVDATFTLSPETGTTVYDETDWIGPLGLEAIAFVASTAESTTGIAPVFYIHRVPAGGTADASGVANALVDAWAGRMPGIADTAVVLIEMGGDSLCPTDIAVRVGSAYQPYLSPADAERLAVSDLLPVTDPGCDPYAVALAAAAQLSSATMPGPTSSPTIGADAPAVGPPFPDHIAGRWVYDYAGVFSADTIAKTQATIDAIEARTGAQIAVYTQLKPWATSASTEQDAIKLMDQWGVGRKGSTTDSSSSGTSTARSSTDRSSCTQVRASGTSSPTSSARRSSRTTWSRSSAQANSTGRCSPGSAGSTSS